MSKADIFGAVLSACGAHGPVGLRTVTALEPTAGPGARALPVEHQGRLAHLTSRACFSQLFHGDRDAIAEQLGPVVAEDPELHVEPSA